MKTCYRLLMIMGMQLCQVVGIAQPVARTTVVEHFTNTYCSICAGRNPGFFENLSGFPDVLHLAYYPSAPYPACPFNQMNKAENDARTNYYGIYGATPRLVVNGSVLSGNTDYEDPVIFQGMSSQSDYALSVSTRRKDNASAEATIKIKKVAGLAANGLQLYAVVSEDTVSYSAHNGETTHYDVFHKSLTGNEPQSISSISAVGDSLVLSFSFLIGSGWGRTSVTALLQDSTKTVLQAARSAPLYATTGVPPVLCTGVPLCMHPVPARNELFFASLPSGYHNYSIVNSYGQRVKTGVVYDVAQPINLTELPAGYYIITLGEGVQMMRGSFVKG
jgi:hypothetical protein